MYTNMKQHKQIRVRDLRVKSGVKAGTGGPQQSNQHNETLVRDLLTVRYAGQERS